MRAREPWARIRFVLQLTALAALLGVAALPNVSAGGPAAPRMESVCFYFPDGSTLNVPFVTPPHRSDNLEIRAALVEVATQHRDKAIREGKATGREDRMLLAAMTDQWTEGGMSCVQGWYRSGMKGYLCTCNAAGGGCVRVIVE